jgi:uncharacterized membrane protein YcaP (DUF421 family)
MEPFNLQRILFGEIPALFLLEIIFRTVVLYLYTLGVLRLIGQRGMERLSSFDFAIVIAMGSAVGDPMFYPNIPLIHGMVVVTTILAIERGLGLITKRDSAVESVLEGVTLRAVHEGCIEADFMKESVLSKYELFMKMREHGARQLGEVEVAYLELDGGYSVFLYPPEQVRPGLPLLPPWDIAPPREYKAGDPAPKAGLYACSTCGQTIRLAQGDAFPKCDRCGESGWVEAVSEHHNGSGAQAVVSKHANAIDFL